LKKSARTSATAKTKTEADPYGMTNRKASATTTTTAIGCLLGIAKGEAG
jgi:hypothetical protein